MLEKSFLKERENVLKKLHNILKKKALSALRNDSNTYKTVDLDSLIGFGFNSDRLLNVVHEEIYSLTKEASLSVQWMRGKLKCKIKFTEPQLYLEYIGYKSEETKLDEFKATLSFCKTEISKEFVKNLTVYDLKRKENVGFAARFINYVSNPDYEGNDIRTLSAAIYTGHIENTSEKDASKILDKKLSTIKNILEVTIPERKQEIEKYYNSIYKFKDPLYVYGKIRIETDTMILKNIQKPYLPIIPNNIINVVPECDYLVTVENKTSFHVFAEIMNNFDIENMIVVFTSGNSKPDIIDLLNHIIKKQNLNKIYHFGDIDHGGINIRRHIESQTGCQTIPIIWTEELIQKHGTKLKYKSNNADNKIEKYAIDNHLRVEQETINRNVLYKMIESHFKKER